MALFSLKAITDLLHVPTAILINEQPNSGRKQIVPLSKTLHSRRQTFIQKQILIRTWWSYCPQVQRAVWRKYSRKREPLAWGPNKLGEGNLGNKKWPGKKGWYDIGPEVGTEPACALSRKREQEITGQWMQPRTGSENFRALRESRAKPSPQYLYELGSRNMLYVFNWPGKIKKKNSISWPATLI